METWEKGEMKICDKCGKEVERTQEARVGGIPKKICDKCIRELTVKWEKFGK